NAHTLLSRKTLNVLSPHSKLAPRDASLMRLVADETRTFAARVARVVMTAPLERGAPRARGLRCRHARRRLGRLRPSGPRPQGGWRRRSAVGGGGGGGGECGRRVRGNERALGLVDHAARPRGALGRRGGF